MWKLLYGSVPGTSHQRRGEPCQDSAFGLVARPVQDPVLVVACADGAGSARHSAAASRLACTALVHLIAAALEGGLTVGDIDREKVLSWHGEVLDLLSAAADQQAAPLREFACTLLTGIVGRDRAVFSQVGDGAIVILDGDGYRTVFWPQSGEYANTTNFLTDRDLGTHLDFCVLEAAVDEVALLTDGLQMLALAYARREAHGPFFAPLFLSLRQAATAAELSAPLLQFLNSPAVNERTDDDKTLVLATRRLPDENPEPVR